MKICLATSSRNEKHIIEYIKYYIKIGIDYFIIYDDFSDIPIEQVFKENNIDKSIYTIFRNDNTDDLYSNINQKRTVIKCYHCDTWKKLIIPKLIEKNIDYVLYVDVDEFLYINKFKNIQELVKDYLPFDVLKINWLFFGSNSIIKNDGINNIIDLFTKSDNLLRNGTLESKSITKVSSISTANDAYCYGPHELPIIENAIVKDIEKTIQLSYGKKLSQPTTNLINNSYSNKIYIAHYSCQDLTTFVKRKFTNKTNYYWWVDFIGVDTRINVYKYIDTINENFDEFVKYLDNRINNNVKENNDFLNIPGKYIQKMISLLNYFNQNKIENNDIKNFKYK